MGIAVLVLAALAVLSVNTFPAVTEDSLVYLEHSRALADGGLVEYGFRNVGYPVFIRLVRSAAGFVGAEPLLTIAILQRVLLLGLVVYVWRLWSWYALPLTLVVVAPEIVAITNFVLIEGLGVGLALLMAVGVYQCLRPATTAALEVGDAQRWTFWFVILCTVSIALFTLKFTLAGFLAVPIVVAVAAWRQGIRKPVLVTLSIWALAVGGFALGLSVENLDEQGAFVPSYDSNTAALYYAWVVVHGDPEGAPPGYFIPLRPIVNATLPHVVGPQEASKLRHEAVVDILDEAGIDYRMSQVESFLWALTGGRFHETGNAVTLIKGTTRTNIDRAIHMNTFSTNRGYSQFSATYNDGLVPGAVITDSIGRDVLPDGREVVKWMLPLSLLIAMAGMFVRRTRWLGVAAFVPMIAQAAGLGVVRADTFRYLVSAAIYTIATATAVAFVWFSSRAPADSEGTSAPIAPSEVAEPVAN